ncbi:adenylate/guanylate cyclase domain-containing protein [Reyranella sp.]|jgi:adenylate cyclase|uniref:adenylate/guanylate cyclase domain-containing protein n=1 Tax=Reyranella sp. TaxID=1929291 RepID=UPI000BCA9FE8|nr:adenylate/guanylate cyclase domain-containing protein [Reyranella sp.]OYY38752.1 MAG: adenylate/guanylate cyclase domain-containing protein [Rhodospirillales bacterium 35-66-84]OYZ92219.1 MAG: adenylate/guanylate cyclase domain-containing protein [Rhodospirillales bacterium 24-66-33]OZB23623.1 MAG: adenylate/guanylate cyclase domain-containing protein [Rhodospirillales bacterium 39-66-50]HQS15405.1 adenylate/guanylate cyclase domain-containing protein [Reyranella sp.]HQT11931.1 adenylate/gu
MTLLDTDILLDWIVRRGLDGLDEGQLLREFCEKCREAGLMVSRALSFIDTLHPVHEGRIYRWRDDSVEEEAAMDYARTDQGGPAAESWQRSPFFHLLQTGEEELRRRIGFGEEPGFGIIQEMKDLGHTDYIVFIHRFAGDTKIGDMDGVYSAWSTRHSEGFSDANIMALRRLVPALALAIKSAALARIADTLVQVYLGRDAGRRVLEGSIQRGVADRVEAALWFSDLRSYTAITDTAKPSDIIPLLNDYAEAVITSIHEAGGDVLKLIGDGTLAVFRTDDPAEACRCALRAEENLRTRMTELNERRLAAEQPVTTAYIGLHIGEVFYGNIGSFDRLDFTVVGPAVNETSRIASMCRSVDRPVLVSSTFAEALTAEERARLVSVGRFALRGVGRAQDLFTIDPELL